MSLLRFKRSRDPAQPPHEGALLPRRPRTPLRIGRDLTGILAAQASPVGGNEAAVASSTPRCASAAVPSSSPFASGKRDLLLPSAKLGGDRAREFDVFSPSSASASSTSPAHATESIGHSKDSSGHPKKTAELGQTSGGSPSASSQSPSPAGAARKPIASRGSIKRQSSMKRSGLDAQADVGPQSRAREPAETQKLTVDLKLLEAAAAIQPKEALRQKKKPFQAAFSSLVENIDEALEMRSKRGSMQNSRRRSSARDPNWDRPWRSPPARVSVRKASVLTAATHRMRGSVRRSLMEGKGFEVPKAVKAQVVGESKEDAEAASTNNGPPGPRAGSRHSDADASHGFRSLWKKAMDWKIPHDLLTQAYDIFKKHTVAPAAWSSETNKSHLSVGHGTASAEVDATELELTRDQFAEVLCVLASVKAVDELPPGLLYDSFATADRDGNEGIDFHEFAMWYSRYGFSEEMLLTKGQREMRDVARKLNISVSEIERYKKLYDMYDLDSNGQIDMQEFENLLQALLKVPSHLELPASRIKQFWNETDSDGDGEIAFEEFIAFYCKLFLDENGETTPSPLETFYQGVRPNAMRTPPAKKEAPGGQSPKKASVFLTSERSPTNAFLTRF